VVPQEHPAAKRSRLSQVRAFNDLARLNLGRVLKPVRVNLRAANLNHV
jgi:hypothetical protein